MSRTSFEVAVLGLGSMGAFTCLELARRKATVIGFDRFEPPHDRGSHSGDSRVYREAYAEHPAYVPLAKRAGQLWERLGSEFGNVLLHRSGMLSIGDEDSPLIRGIHESATRYALAVERLSTTEIHKRWPAIEPPQNAIGLFEPTAGWIDVNSALSHAITQARQYGADIRLNCAVEEWSARGQHFSIRTRHGTANAERLLITAGAWSANYLQTSEVPLRVLRKLLIWVDPLRADLFSADRFPIFAVADRFFYGFPNLHGEGVKLGIHLDPAAPETRADVLQPPVQPAEIEPILALAATWLPALAGQLPGAMERVLSARTCLYTMTPDEHFIVDRHPRFENAWIAAGFSGHGFKFAPAVGEALADLALRGVTPIPIDFLRRAGRFSGEANRADPLLPN